MLMQFHFEPNLTHYVHNEAPFAPSFHSSFQSSYQRGEGVVITLDATVHSLLNWESEIAQAHQEQAKGAHILWELDFGPWNMETCFAPLRASSASLAIKHFCDQVWPSFQEASFGLIIGRMGAMPLDLDRIDEISPGSTDAKGRYFDIISHELHRIAAQLPEELMAFALFDLTSIESYAEQARLFSSDRFPHLQLALQGAKVPFFGLNWEYGQARGGSIDGAKQEVNEPLVGVCLPADQRIDEEVSGQMEGVFKLLSDREIAYRMIPEGDLTESWYGLDELIVFPTAMDPQVGERQCIGFTISGGTVVSVGSEFGLEGEVSIEKWNRGRGI